MGEPQKRLVLFAWGGLFGLDDGAKFRLLHVDQVQGCLDDSLRYD